MRRLAAVRAPQHARGVCVVSRETVDPGSRSHCRFFAPHYGIPEDIVTGSVHSALGVWLLEAGALPAADGRVVFTAEQGDGLGRPGRLQVELTAAAGRAARVRVGGRAVTVLTGSLRSERVSARVGVDIGGTFTDIVLRLPDGTLRVSKVSSTPRGPRAAVVAGSTRCCARRASRPASVGEVLHGTTVGSNTILQKKGARGGLLTTRGFRDVLEIGRVRTPDLFDLTWDKPVPLVERRHRLRGRRADRRRRRGRAPARSRGRCWPRRSAWSPTASESVAICFLNTYVNPAHELPGRAPAGRALPQLASPPPYRVLPEIKEYERTSTTVVNAYVLPVMRRYLAALAAGLRRIGVDGAAAGLASNGGAVGAARRGRAAGLLRRLGPAAGVVGAARLGQVDRHAESHRLRHGRHHRLGVAGRGRRASRRTTEYEFRDGISTPSRFIKAGGYMMSVPTVDVAEVGSGAGSIAAHRRRRAAARRPGVGRRAIRARPATAWAATRPTVTDANVVLGFLTRAPGRRRARRSTRSRRARRSETHVAEPLGLSRRRGRARHPRGRQRQHGARDPRRHGRARARSARLRPGRLRRQRPGARLRPGRARSTSAACSCRPRPASSPRWACWPATSSTISSAPLARPLDDARSSRANARPRRDAAEALAAPRRRRAIRGERCGSTPRSTCASSARRPSSSIPIRAPRLRADRLPALRDAFARAYARDLRLRRRRGARAGQRARWSATGAVPPAASTSARSAWPPGRRVPAASRLVSFAGAPGRARRRCSRARR